MLQLFETSYFIRLLSFLKLAKPADGKTLKLLIKILLTSVIISASFSFKIPLLNFGGESAFIKIDDIFLLLLALFSLFRIRQWQSSLLDPAIFIFILLCVISVFRGIIIGTVAFPVVSVLYLLKVAEYFLVFYLAFNLITKKTDARFYLSVIFATALLISIYGIIEHFFPYPHRRFSYPFFYRIYERGYFYHDANHFAVYLMFVSSIIFGLFIYTGSNILKKLILLVIFSSLSLALFWTYSRAAYAALLVSVLITASFRGKRVLVATLVFLILFIFLLAPHAILERIYSSKIALLSPNYNESSVAYRVHQAKFALETVRQYPLFGIGLGARERVFYENQFIMFLSELGTVGFAAFFVLIFLIFKTALSLFRSAQNSLIKGFSAGYIAGLFGLLIECNTLVVFMISRIAMPFWLLTAILFWLGKEAKK